MKRSYRFIATMELGRLARWLRVLGFDCAFFDPKRRKDIVIESLREGRVILTRDSKMSRFSGIRMIRIESDFVRQQLCQVMDNLRLKPDRARMFTRCVECNTPTAEARKEDFRSKIPPYVYKTQDEFMHCPGCGKVYWKGTHWDLANEFLDGAK